MNERNSDALRRARSRGLRTWGLYLLILVAWVAVVALVALVGIVVCAGLTWQPGPVYSFLNWVRDYLPFVAAACVLAGWVVISYFFIARAAREAEQRKNDLVVYLAHDLKTPLTSVIGYLTLLRDEPQLSPELRARYTGIALDKAERLEELINEFFGITRFNLSHLELEKQPVDLCRMLQQVVSEFAPMLGERDLTCALELPPSLEYDCDPDKLARVFDNLLRNACHYSTPGSVVRISGGEEGDSIVLRFLNSGRTIPPEKLARIFDQFFRLDSSRATRTGGAGLGLAIAKEILTLHGGTITAWSREDQVCFQVTLPRGGRREEGPAREP